MKRRRALHTGLALLALATATGHTPFGQWAVYRRKHLLILTDKTQPGSFELGQRLAALLAEYLPDSKARVTRAPYTERVASLLSSAQLDVALLPAPVARALYQGQPPFADYGPVELRTLIRHADFLLVARADFPDHHAYQVAATLLTRGSALGLSAPADGPPPAHPGVTVYMQGRPQPEPPAEPPEHSDSHDH